MTAAFAPALPAGDTPLDGGASSPGTQILLTLKPARQFYLAEIAAVAIYALIIAAGLNYKSKPIEAPPEEPLELVLAPAEPPPEPPPPPPDVKQPEPEPPPPPPPPEAVTPPVAPVEPPPPPKPKLEKPKPKPIPKPAPKVVERKPAPKVEAKPRAQPRRAVAAAPARPVPAGASASVIANQLHGCLLRAGANLYPESQRPRSATVGYRASISASGSVSFSWSSSGNSAFDSAARQAGSRCSSVQAPGRPAALSGSISFRS
jgi:protein TonB